MQAKISNIILQKYEKINQIRLDVHQILKIQKLHL